MAAEIGKISKSIENELLVSEARVAALDNGLAQLSGQRLEDSEAMITLRALEREAESTQLIFDTFLATYKRSDEQEELQESEARVISYAVAPQRPAFPNVLC